jgi:hypothetical protein
MGRQLAAGTDRALTIDAASKKSARRVSATLDWRYRGDRSMVLHHLALEIAQATERKCQPPSSLYLSFLSTDSRFL